jgi:hypothetical protein
MPLVSVQSCGSKVLQRSQHTHYQQIQAPPPGLRQNSTAKQSNDTEEIVFESETCMGLGRPVPLQTLDMAHLTSPDHGRHRFSTNRETTGTATATTTIRHVDPSQGLRDTSNDSRSDTNFPVITFRPPLRPTPSYSTESPFSYYSSASLDLQHKSLAVAAEEEAESLDSHASSTYSARICLATLFALIFFCGIDISAPALILPVWTDDPQCCR